MQWWRKKQVWALEQTHLIWRGRQLSGFKVAPSIVVRCAFPFLFFLFLTSKTLSKKAGKLKFVAKPLPGKERKMCALALLVGTNETTTRSSHWHCACKYFGADTCYVFQASWKRKHSLPLLSSEPAIWAYRVSPNGFPTPQLSRVNFSHLFCGVVVFDLWW